MDLQLNDRIFLVGGVTSGFGKAIAERLMAEGAKVIGVARRPEKVAEMAAHNREQFMGISGDITDPRILEKLDEVVNVCSLSGIVLNAGGPPATSAQETTLDQWDAAYEQVLKWKVRMVQHFLPNLLKVNYGRLLFIESYSVKQPVPNLVLSNSLRMAVVGYVKTLSQEIADSGVTMNILAPGFHSTPAAERVVKKHSETQGKSIEEAEQAILHQIPMGKMGNTADFASLAAWLLSPHSGYLTGQTVSVDGGAVYGSMG